MALACSLPLPPRSGRSRCDTHMCEYVCDCVCVRGVRESGVQVLEMCMHYRERDRAFKGGRAPMHLNLCDDLGSARKQEVLSGDGCCVNETVLAKLLKLGYLRSFCVFFFTFLIFPPFSSVSTPSPLLDFLQLETPIHSKVCAWRAYRWACRSLFTSIVALFCYRSKKRPPIGLRGYRRPSWSHTTGLLTGFDYFVFKMSLCTLISLCILI